MEINGTTSPKLGHTTSSGIDVSIFLSRGRLIADDLSYTVLSSFQSYAPVGLYVVLCYLFVCPSPPLDINEFLGSLIALFNNQDQTTMTWLRECCAQN